MVLPLEKDIMNMHVLQTIRVILWAVKPHLLSILPSSLWKFVPVQSGHVRWRLSKPDSWEEDGLPGGYSRCDTILGSVLGQASY